MIYGNLSASILSFGFKKTINNIRQWQKCLLPQSKCRQKIRAQYSSEIWPPKKKNRIKVSCYGNFPTWYSSFGGHRLGIIKCHINFHNSWFSFPSFLSKRHNKKKLQITGFQLNNTLKTILHWKCPKHTTFLPNFSTRLSSLRMFNPIW